MASNPVKLRTIFAHPVHGCAGPGEIISVDDQTAQALIEGGYADEVTPRPKPASRESAAVSTPETAMQSKAVRKTR